MVQFISIFFIGMSILVIGYLISLMKTNKRIHFLVEFFFISAYIIVMFIFLFPKSLRILETTFGISSAINFILYLSIFVAYFFLFLLYQKNEDLRREITKLTQEIALRDSKDKNSKK